MKKHSWCAESLLCFGKRLSGRQAPVMTLEMLPIKKGELLNLRATEQMTDPVELWI